MNKRIIWLFLLLNSLTALAQTTSTQTVRGTVLDKDSKTPLIGVGISVVNANPPIATVTDIDGNFRLAGVPVGRQTIKAAYLGYDETLIPELLINSAKEVVLSIEMSQSVVQTQEVVITASQPKDKPINEMSTVSSRSFNVEEMGRYASSVNDVARMAAGFPGVAPNKDNNNDIIVRGNSPVGVLWRLEGIDIPNPNHFARRGSTGGGISIINASLMDNSDFSTGAFAAEYGNALSAAFDLRFRKGNNEKREYTFKAGMIGLEMAAEGPFSTKNKDNGSYLVNYRYSTLGILNNFGLYLVGKNVSNTFQDINFNLNFPTKKSGTFTVFGIAGLSKETRVAESDTSLWKIRTDFSHYNFVTNMGAIGATWLKPLNEKTYLKTILMAGVSDVTYNEDTARKDLMLTPYSREHFSNGRYSLHSFINHKFSARHTLKAGLLASNLFYNLSYSVFNRSSRKVEPRINGTGNTFLMQPYVQMRSRLGSNFSFNYGLHAMYLTLNSKYSVEPRIGVKWDFAENQSLSAGAGLHNQMQPLGNYFTQTTTLTGAAYYPNKNLDFSRAEHYVLAYDVRFGKSMRLKLEPYYQRLSKLAVGYSASSTYLMLNERDGYAKDTLSSTGNGLNKGIDLTLEKFFSSRLFFLFAASVFDSKYQPNNKVWYNTRYNMKNVFSLLAGKEWELGAGIFELGTRLVYMGGQWYSPVDPIRSAQTGETVRNETNPFSVRMPDYYRADLRIAYKVSRAKFASIVALDIQNISMHKNVWKQEYDFNTKQVTYVYQSGLIPVISYRVDF